MPTAIALTSLLATLPLACAMPSRELASTSGHRAALISGAANSKDLPMTDAALDRALLPGARDAAQHVLNFLSRVQSTHAFTSTSLGEAMGVTLGPDPNNDPGWAVYHSADLGQGWTYWVQFAAPEATMKPGFRFWFDHPDGAADATPVCALPLEQLRATLTAHGWVERKTLSEIGSISAVKFAKNDMVLTLTQRDGAEVNGTSCVLSLQTADGR